MTWSDFLIRVSFALCCGAVIGAERQFRQRMAGLRTNALVAIGACLFVTLAELTPGMHNEAARIAAQVVSGIGFLGAGVIMRDGLNVRGLNTAATLWCAAAVGVLAGMHLLVEGALATLVVLCANIVLREVAQKINRQPSSKAETELPYRLRIVCLEVDEVHIRSLVMSMLSAMPLALHSLQSQDIEHAIGRLEVCADLLGSPENQNLLEQIVARISLERGVSAVSWKVLTESSTPVHFVAQGTEPGVMQ
ncbi:MAG: MgtC/SapB family protein [Glaciimonas sp.]|nr:MgtC/SapB family protein [Glaciimonas sp.]